ncbi:hypothetical protein BDV3_006627 [Batrachochytrium dendrobatidis]
MTLFRNSYNHELSVPPKPSSALDLLNHRHHIKQLPLEYNSHEMLRQFHANSSRGSNTSMVQLHSPLARVPNTCQHLTNDSKTSPAFHLENRPFVSTAPPSSFHSSTSRPFHPVSIQSITHSSAECSDYTDSLSWTGPNTSTTNALASDCCATMEKSTTDHTMVVSSPIENKNNKPCLLDEPCLDTESSTICNPRSAFVQSSNSDNSIDSSIRYEAVIEQEPVRARMCGFSNGRDRRLLRNPPLIVQIFTYQNNVRTAIDLDQHPSLMCHVSLWSEDGTQHFSAVKNPRAAQPYRFTDDMEGRSALMNHLSLSTLGASSSQLESDQYCDIIIGTTIVKSTKLQDLDNNGGVYFVFPDLSIRSPGRFTLRCNVMDLNMSTQVSSVVAMATTSVFEVYSSKSFPGALEPTSLSRAFASQGIVLHFRNDRSRNRESVLTAKRTSNSTERICKPNVHRHSPR